MKRFVPFAVFLLATQCLAQGPGEERSKVKLLTDQQLIDCLKGPKSCALDTRYYEVNNIKWELADRKHPDLIIAAYNKADDIDRYLLVKTLWYIDNPLVEGFMRSIAFSHLGEGADDSPSFFALDYLAQYCDLRALARLNRDVNFKTYMGCTVRTDDLASVWADTLEAFGRCNYVPAAQNLVRSLNPSCLNGPAEKDLRQIFPGYCSNPSSTKDEQLCYERLFQPDAKRTITSP